MLPHTNPAHTEININIKLIPRSHAFDYGKWVAPKEPITIKKSTRGTGYWLAPDRRR